MLLLLLFPPPLQVTVQSPLLQLLLYPPGQFNGVVAAAVVASVVQASMAAVVPPGADVVPIVLQHLTLFGWDGQNPWRTSPSHPHLSTQVPPSASHSGSWKGMLRQHLLSFPPGHLL